MDAPSRKLGTTLAFAAFAVAFITLVLWLRQVNLVALPDNRGFFVLSFLTALGLGVAALIARPRWFAVLPALAAIVVGAFVPFSVSISKQEVATTGIQIGQTIPRFAALDQHGASFDSASLDGKPILMKFFRGHW